MIVRHPLTFRTPHSAFRIRAGMSMAEVLVALFLLALGTIAILTMFPLGMYQMGQALKDDRAAQCAQQADQYMRTQWRTTAVEQPPNAGGEAFFAAMANADNPTPPVAVGFKRGLPFLPPGVPSYPVVVDPIGWFSPWSAQQQVWVCGSAPFPAPGVNYAVLPRRTLNPVAGNVSLSNRVCSMLDGFGFSENGSPSMAGGALERELRYNWLWILQQPDTSVPTTASMTVVVFDKRAFQYAAPGAEQIFASSQVAGGPVINMQPLSTVVQVPTALGVPPVQKGGWIMDATYYPVGVSAFFPQGMRHAIFYRVASVTDNPAMGTTDIELQTPIRRLDGSPNPFNGTLVYMAGVSEVFERPNLTPNDF